jgi:hypothetical protein
MGGPAKQIQIAYKDETVKSLKEALEDPQVAAEARAILRKQDAENPTRYRGSNEK